MKNYWLSFTKKHRIVWKKKDLLSLVTSFVLLGVALIVQRLADGYVSKLNGIPVRDLILDHIPALDLDGFIIFSTLTFTFIVVALFIAKPRYINIGLKTFALFLIVRSFFITLTHLGANPHELYFDPTTIGYWLYNVLYNTHGDFFFSGHTGLPFLIALIFWPEERWRYFCLAITLIFGLSVLLAHIHYSIDVFAAPFMTYGIFTLARNIFKHDYVVSRTLAK